MNSRSARSLAAPKLRRTPLQLLVSQNPSGKFSASHDPPSGNVYFNRRKSGWQPKLPGFNVEEAAEGGYTARGSILFAMKLSPYQTLFPSQNPFGKFSASHPPPRGNDAT